MVAFDLLYLNGYGLRTLPLIESKALLKKLVDKTGPSIQRQLRGSRPRDVRARLQDRLDGVVSKVSGSKYSTGRRTTRSRSPVYGRRKGKDLVYAGKLTTASTARTRRRCGAPHPADPQDPALQQAHWPPRSWVEPELFAEMEYGAKSAEGTLHAPRYQSIRSKKLETVSAAPQ
jgi:bifunctional non-homologous end joining protein LigD